MRDIAVVYFSQVPDDMSLASPLKKILKKVRRNATQMRVTLIPEDIEKLKQACR